MSRCRLACKCVRACVCERVARLLCDEWDEWYGRILILNNEKPKRSSTIEPSTDRKKNICNLLMTTFVEWSRSWCESYYVCQQTMTKTYTTKCKSEKTKINNAQWNSVWSPLGCQRMLENSILSISANQRMNECMNDESPIRVVSYNLLFGLHFSMWIGYFDIS